METEVKWVCSHTSDEKQQQRFLPQGWDSGSVPHLPYRVHPLPRYAQQKPWGFLLSRMTPDCIETAMARSHSTRETNHTGQCSCHRDGSKRSSLTVSAHWHSMLTSVTQVRTLWAWKASASHCNSYRCQCGKTQTFLLPLNIWVESLSLFCQFFLFFFKGWVLHKQK